MSTNFKYGLKNRGVPVEALGFGYGMDSSSTVYFVDDKTGNDGNTGTDPSAAFKTIGKAISTAGAWDVIYIAPKVWTSLEYSYPGLNTAYAESNTIPYAKAGLAIVGIAHQGLVGVPHGVVIRETASATTANMAVNAPMCAFENLAFERGGTETGGQLTFQGGVAASNEGNAGSVYNCYFFYGNGTTAISPGYAGAISAGQVWGLTVRNNYFLGCRGGIQFNSGTATAGSFIAQGNIFCSRNATASEIDFDIMVYTQGAACVVITDNYFAHLIPTLSGGSALRYVSIQSDVRQGIVANNHIGNAHNTTLTTGPSGTAISTPTNIGIGGHWADSALMGSAS